MRTWGLIWNNRVVEWLGWALGLIKQGLIKLHCLLVGHNSKYNRRGQIRCYRCNQRGTFDPTSKSPPKGAKRVYLNWDDFD